MPRFGHSLVTDRRGSLWMFGGYSLSHGLLNDIRLFDTKNNTWIPVTVDSTRGVSMPQGRYFHAAEIINLRREIYIFGGIGSVFGSENQTLNDFWKFSIKHQRWCYVKTENVPPSVAGHTLTFMKDVETENLFLIGGFGANQGFLNKIWYFSLKTENWHFLNTSGTVPRGIFGHTTVYHSISESFYIYGGYLFSEFDNKRIYSNRLYAFHYPTLKWHLLPTFEEYTPAILNFPEARFLHSAITTKDYMLIFGGKTFSKKFKNVDLILTYSYECNQWIRLMYQGAPVVGLFPPFTYAQAMTYDLETEAIYIVGGFDNVMRSDVTRINLPLDLCNLWKGKDNCRSFLGCSFCSVVRPDKSLRSHCYSSTKPLKESCGYYNGTLITNNGVVCDHKWFQRRNCENFNTCAQCMAKWPIYINEKPICKWCKNCLKEGCISVNDTCQGDTKCETLVNIEQCGNSSCLSTDCFKQQNNNSFVLEEKTSSLFYPHCSKFTNCSLCLAHDCRWSTTLKNCIDPDFQPLFCAGGICGLVLKPENSDQCPKPCSSYNQCATCLKNYHCGWCSANISNYSGEGLCTEGTIDHLLTYDGNQNCQFLLNRSFEGVKLESVKWNFDSCPAENECLNDHHTCDLFSEVCKDLDEGFQCVCGSGYELSPDECKPVCTQGCVRGKCVKPDKCLCDFGYVGINCSIQCLCNGHSNCEGPDKLSDCKKCHNNTKGAQCERCKPLYVGDPTNNGKCVPCFEYCHQHTDVCVNDSWKQLIANKSISELKSMLEEGPTSNALCVRCANQTSGRKCETCMEGYFRGTDDLNQHCRP